MKHLLYLGPDGRQLWCKTAEGWQPAHSEPEEPVWVVSDYAEESFAEIEMPRLFGRDRSAFLARQLLGRFPDTRFRAAIPTPQTGGLMDRLAPTRQLLIGINNPERLDAELGSRPIAGIWPLSQLLSLFCQKCKLPPEVLVVLPHADALRIVYLKQHTPILTRLAPTPGGTSAQIEEIIRTRRYLENTRAIERDQACPILLLDHRASFASQLAAAQFELIPPPAPWHIQPPADWRFPLFDLALQTPPGQVAPLAQRTDFLARRLRQMAWVAAILTLAAGGWAASDNLSAIRDTLQQKAVSASEAQRLATQKAEVEAKIAGFGVDPELLRRAIALNDEEIVSVPDFHPILQQLAQAISAFPEQRLKELQWQLLPPGSKPCAKDSTPATPDAAASQPETASGDNQAPPIRLFEISLQMALPDTYGPRDQAQLLRKISQQLGHIAGAKLIQDPASELERGILKSAADGQSEKNQSWCLTLPGDRRPAPATPAGAGS